MSQTMMPPGGAAAPPPAPPADDTGGDANKVQVTICGPDGGPYTVYAGDEPEEGDGGDMSMDDTAAMGDAGDQAAPQGEPADSVGAALKIVMGILQGATQGGSAPADNFAAGFGTPPSGQAAQKY